MISGETPLAVRSLVNTPKLPLNTALQLDEQGL